MVNWAWTSGLPQGVGVCHDNVMCRGSRFGVSLYMQGRLTNTGLKGREDSLWRFGAFDGISDTPLLTYIASSDNRCWSDAFWIDDIILPRTIIIPNLCFN